MSAKKEAKGGKPAPVAPAKKAKVDPATKIKRNADGTKAMKVARGTERRRRREGLRQDWKTHPNAKQMLKPGQQTVAEAQAA